MLINGNRRKKQCLPMYTSVQQCTPIYTSVHDVHRCTQCTSVYTSVHKCTSLTKSIIMLVKKNNNLSKNLDLLSIWLVT